MSDALLKELHNLIDEIELKTRGRINLIPSENIMSKAAATALSLQFGQRYVFPNIGDTLLYWPGMNDLSRLLFIVEELVRSLFQVTYCSVRPLSGLHCMTVILSFFKRRNIETVYFVPWEFGGHGNSQKIAERFGLEIGFLPFDKELLDIDRKTLLEILPANRKRVAFYIDQWVSLKTPDIRELRVAVGDEPYIHHDVSHLMGLIAGRVVANPLELGANSFGGSTHKTLPGPQKAILAWNDQNLSDGIEQEICAFVSHPHTGSLAALGKTLAEFQVYGKQYATQVLKNARVLGAELAEFGVNVVGREFGYTTTHQIVADLRPDMELRFLGEALRMNSISLNFLDPGILYCKQPVRLGVQELTALGWMESDMKTLACFLELILKGEKPNQEIKNTILNLSANNVDRAFISL